MSFLLMVFLTLVCLPEPDPQGASWYPEAPWGSDLGDSLGAVGVFLVLVGLHAWWVARRFSRPVTQDPGLRDFLLPRYERGRFFHQVFLLACFAILLWCGWGYTSRQMGSWDGWALPGVELLTLTPLLAGLVLSWLFFYDADRAADRAAHLLIDDPFAHTWTEPRSASAETGTDADRLFGGRWSYVAFQARQRLALVSIPVLLLILLKGIARLFSSSGQDVQWVLNGVGFVALAGVFLVMPWLVRLMLGLTPLPDGPLRARLLAASHRLGFRCSEILLWDTRRTTANAMVIGLLPWLRYVVFTDRLLEEFTEDEVEAVYGHEVGHIRHQHMLYYLGFLTLSMVILGLLADNYLVPHLKQWAEWAVPENLAGGRGNDLAMIPVVGLMLGYIFLVFGLLSRRCERQADVYGCRTVSCAAPACLGHDTATPRSIRGKHLCSAGIRTFIQALEKVALVNGISRERPGFLQSWQHGSIASRVHFLESLLRNPHTEPVFQREVAVFRWTMIVALSGVLMLLFYLGNRL